MRCRARCRRRRGRTPPRRRSSGRPSRCPARRTPGPGRPVRPPHPARPGSRWHASLASGEQRGAERHDRPAVQEHRACAQVFWRRPAPGWPAAVPAAAGRAAGPRRGDPTSNTMTEAIHGDASMQALSIDGETSQAPTPHHPGRAGSLPQRMRAVDRCRPRSMPDMRRHSCRMAVSAGCACVAAPAARTGGGRVDEGDRRGQDRQAAPPQAGRGLLGSRVCGGCTPCCAGRD